jgi:hypothetical protein
MSSSSLPFKVPIEIPSSPQSAGVETKDGLPFLENDSECGIVNLRTPTARGNILVVNGFLSLPAVAQEIQSDSLTVQENRSQRIAQLIREDTELDPAMKRVYEQFVKTCSESAVHGGITSLRTPTARGNVLVVGNTIDVEALEREVTEIVSDRISRLIENDSALPPDVKEAAVELCHMLESPRGKFWCWCLFGGIAAIPGLLQFIIGAVLVGAGDVMALIGAGLLGVGLVVILIGVAVLCSRRSRIRSLKLRITGRRSGPILTASLLKEDEECALAPCDWGPYGNKLPP